MQSCRNWVIQHACSTKVKHGNTLPSCINSHNVNKHPLVISLITLKNLCTFLVISLFKMIPKHCAEALSSILSVLWCAWVEKMCYISFTQEWVIMLSKMSSMTVSKQHIFSNMSLNRSIHKRKSYIAADKKHWYQGTLSYPYISSSAKVQYSLIQGSRWLRRI